MEAWRTAPEQAALMSSARLFFSLMLLSSAAVSHAAEDAKPRVAVLMFDGVQIIDFAGPYEVFGQAGFDVFTVSRDGKPVTTAMNLQVQPTYRFDDAPSAEVVVVPGGHVVDAMKDPSTLDWLRRASGQGCSSGSGATSTRNLPLSLAKRSVATTRPPKVP